MKNQKLSANYKNIQKRKKEIAGQLETLLPKEFHFPNKNIQESIARFGDEALNNMLRGYLEAALWASGEDGEFDSMSIETDISPESILKSKEDLKMFLDKAGDEVYEARWGEFLTGEGSMTQDQIGHDFFLTRNHHGAGFWDRGIGEIGEALTRVSEEMGEVMVYQGDDGKIHIEGGMTEQVISLNEAFISEKEVDIKEKFENWGMKVNDINEDNVSFTDRNGANMITTKEKATDIIEPAIMIRQASLDESFKTAFDESGMMDKYRKQTDLQHGLNVAKKDMGQTDSNINKPSAFRDASKAIGSDLASDEEMNLAYTDLERQLADLEETSDDFLDVMQNKDAASGDIGSDFIDPDTHGDIEDFKSGFENADDEDENSDEMNLAKRNNLARISKMKMDKLSELKKLTEDTSAHELDQKYRTHKGYKNTRDQLIDRGFSSYPSIKSGDHIGFVRSSSPKKLDYKTDDGKIYIEMSFEGAFRKEKKSTEGTFIDNPFLKDIDIKVSFFDRQTYINIGVDGMQKILPNDRKSANSIVNDIKKHGQKALEKFEAAILKLETYEEVSGRIERYKKTLESAKISLANLKPNDLYIQ